MSTRSHQLILASTSSYRRSLLNRLGVAFEAISPGVDEVVPQGTSPDDMAIQLAIRKARAIQRKDALVIGSDQVVDRDGVVLGKPGTRDAAIEQLRRLWGQMHRLITAVCVYDPNTDTHRAAVDVHKLWMRSLSDDEIVGYVDRDLPLDSAGSYKLEQLGIALFDRIEADPETSDDTAIIGLPIMKTVRLLRSFGFDPLHQQDGSKR